jgi:hypothetical protein
MKTNKWTAEKINQVIEQATSELAYITARRVAYLNAAVRVQDSNPEACQVAMKCADFFLPRREELTNLMIEIHEELGLTFYAV